MAVSIVLRVVCSSVCSCVRVACWSSACLFGRARSLLYLERHPGRAETGRAARPSAPETKKRQNLARGLTFVCSLTPSRISCAMVLGALYTGSPPLSSIFHTMPCHAMPNHAMPSSLVASSRLVLQTQQTLFLFFYLPSSSCLDSFSLPPWHATPPHATRVQSAQAAIQTAVTEAKCNLPNGIGVVKVSYTSLLQSPPQPQPQPQPRPHFHTLYTPRLFR